MAKHIRTPEDDGIRGTDESYHAPSGNRHAAGTPAHATGFVPVVAEEGGRHRRHDRRSKQNRYVETDPYDISGHRAHPHRRVTRVISTLLFVVGICLLAVAGWMWWSNQQGYQEQDAINEELAAYVTLDPASTNPPTVNWAELKAVNPEVVAWIQIPGTVVNFPVYQTTDNEKYLHTNAKGEYSVGGQVFLDCDNTAPGMVDAQSIVYGHHLRNGAMFKPISDMQHQQMFDSVSTVWYVTETGVYELEPLLLYKTTDDDLAARTMNFASEDEKIAYFNGLLGRAETRTADAEQKIATMGPAITLCTCNYDNGDSGRTLLVCVPKASADAPATTDAA